MFLQFVMQYIINRLCYTLSSDLQFYHTDTSRQADEIACCCFFSLVHRNIHSEDFQLQNANTDFCKQSSTMKVCNGTVEVHWKSHV